MCADCVDIGRLTQGLHKPHKVQNMPLIWHKPYYVTNSSHVSCNLLHSLHCMHYMRCVVLLEIALNAGCKLMENVE